MSQLALVRPTKKPDLVGVVGLGAEKLKKYGPAIMDVSVCVGGLRPLLKTHLRGGRPRWASLASPHLP